MILIKMIPMRSGWDIKIPHLKVGSGREAGIKDLPGKRHVGLEH